MSVPSLPLPFVVQCPHCHEWVSIDQLNCRIFRHGVWKHTMTQIHPHSSQKECEHYVEHDLIYGCGKPFQILLDNTVVPCDYI